MEIKSFWDFLTNINYDKKDIDEIYFDKYNPFMINRALSYFPDTVIYANEMNRYYEIEPFFQHINGKVSGTGKFSHNFTGSSKIPAVHGTQQFRP